MAITSTKIYTGLKNVPQPDSALVSRVPIDVDFPTAAPAANDLIKLIKLPAGVALVDYDFQFPDIDSGTPGFAFSFGVLNAGETDLATVLASGLTIGQSTTIGRSTNSAHLALDNTTERRLAIKVTTAAGTWDGVGKTGIVTVHLRG